MRTVLFSDPDKFKGVRHPGGLLFTYSIIPTPRQPGIGATRPEPLKETIAHES
jgi:hypothetical protein